MTIRWSTAMLFADMIVDARNDTKNYDEEEQYAEKWENEEREELKK